MDFDSFILSIISLAPYFIFTLFLHGALILLNSLSAGYFKTILPSFSAIILGAFFTSMFINLLFFTGFSLFNISMWRLDIILVALDIFLIILTLKRRKAILTSLQKINTNPAEIGLAILVVIMSFIMFRNGGLIDILADSWWHMSLASRLLEDGSIFSLKQHLIGTPIGKFDFDYPFLWHATLAFISYLSNIELPIIWHAIAIPMTALSLIGFYLFSYALTKDQWMALLATVLFCLLYGGLNSYFRVISWPGNISYIGLYMCWYLYFEYLQKADFKQGFKQTIYDGTPYFIAFIVITLCMAAIHGVALMLFFISVALYIYGAIVLSLLNPAFIQRAKIPHQLALILPLLLLGILLGFMLFPDYITKAFTKFYRDSVTTYLTLLLTPVILYVLFLKSKRPLFRITRTTACIVWMVVFIAYSIDWSHFYELFNPSSHINSRQIPKAIIIGDAYYDLPHWSHQLRSALLFSGLLSIPVSLIILWIRQEASTLFLSANALLASLSLTSPVLFWVITAGILSTSSYRVHMLILHPVIYSIAIITLFRMARKHA